MTRNSGKISSIFKKLSFSKLSSLIFFCVTIAGVATSIYMNFVNRSLWLDEAALAFSFSKRPFLQLWDGPLEWLQSAPLGWLYFEKSLALLFGNTEFVLRIGSIFGFAMALVILFLLLKRLNVSTALCLGACAFYANMPFILKYSNVFKPYIFDGFIVLLAIYLFQLYSAGRLRAAILAVAWTLMIWFSTPVAFIMGGLLLSAGIFCLIEKDVRRLGRLIAVGAVILLSFGLHYFLWLGDESIVSGMQAYWEDQNFPLIPTSLADLSKMLHMVAELTTHAGSLRPLVLLMAAYTFPMALYRRQTTLVGCYLGILLALFASWLNMFPIQDRMWCFLYGMLALLSFYSLACIENEDAFWHRLVLCLFLSFLFYPRYHFWVALLAFCISFAVSEILRSETYSSIRACLPVVFALILVFSVDGINHYWNSSDAVFWIREELNTEVEYLNQNLQSDEHVYVYHSSVPGFQYKNGYENNSIAGYENNVTFGKKTFDVGNDCEDEIANVIGWDKTYIASSHYTKKQLEKLLDAIHENGFLQLVSYEHQTPLWFFCKNVEDSKIHVSYKTESVKYYGDQALATVSLINEGPAYINHEFETVYLIDTQAGRLYELPKNIRPGEQVKLILQYGADSSPTFRLENEFGPICAGSSFVPGF